MIFQVRRILRFWRGQKFFDIGLIAGSMIALGGKS
jgi:hypothetical protein